MNSNELDALTVGTKVRAIKEIRADLGEQKLLLHAEKGNVGEVVHVEYGRLPTVRFESGLATIVYPEEVERA